MSKEYIAKGFVYGKFWGGGYGAYPSRELHSKTYKNLIAQAKKELKTGGLDSGMGFESLKGAILDIIEIETIILKGREFKSEDISMELIGDLTEQEQDFLQECLFNQ